LEPDVNHCVLCGMMVTVASLSSEQLYVFIFIRQVGTCQGALQPLRHRAAPGRFSSLVCFDCYFSLLLSLVISVFRHCFHSPFLSLTVVVSRLLLLPPAFVVFYKFLFLSLEVLSFVVPCDTVFCKCSLALISRNIPLSRHSCLSFFLWWRFSGQAAFRSFRRRALRLKGKY